MPQFIEEWTTASHPVPDAVVDFYRKSAWGAINAASKTGKKINCSHVEKNLRDKIASTAAAGLHSQLVGEGVGFWCNFSGPCIQLTHKTRFNTKIQIYIMILDLEAVKAFVSPKKEEDGKEEKAKGDEDKTEDSGSGGANKEEEGAEKDSADPHKKEEEQPQSDQVVVEPPTAPATTTTSPLPEEDDVKHCDRCGLRHADATAEDEEEKEAGHSAGADKIEKWKRQFNENLPTATTHKKKLQVNSRKSKAKLSAQQRQAAVGADLECKLDNLTEVLDGAKAKLQATELRLRTTIEALNDKEHEVNVCHKKFAKLEKKLEETVTNHSGALAERAQEMGALGVQLAEVSEECEKLRQWKALRGEITSSLKSAVKRVADTNASLQEEVAAHHVSKAKIEELKLEAATRLEAVSKPGNTSSDLSTSASTAETACSTPATPGPCSCVPHMLDRIQALSAEVAFLRNKEA